MSNPRISAKERGLLKGAIRRVFSRSDLRRKVIAASQISHSDPKRPRVTKWSRCADCKQPEPSYACQVDHISPIVPISTTLEQMSWDTIVDNVWCAEKGLQVVCKPCHKAKTKVENAERRKHKKKESKK